jgi:hypothetical protein
LITGNACTAEAGNGLLYRFVFQPAQAKDRQLPKPNYAFAKRQRDLLKKQKKEEKRQRKLGTAAPPPETVPPQPVSDKATE